MSILARSARVLVLVPLLLAGCNQKGRPLPAQLDGENGEEGPNPERCDKKAAGCPCSNEGAVAQCGTIKEKRADYVTCSKGVRTCQDGEWSECIADREETKALTYKAPMQGGFSFKALGSAASCNDLCDPECQTLEDTPTGLVVPDTLFVAPTGLTLPSGGNGGNCDDLTVTPPTATVTISAIAADGSVTASPASVDFDGECSGGAEVQPSWTLDSYDRAVVDGEGTVTVYSGVAGPITVTGSSATDSDDSQLNVVVAIGTLATAGSASHSAKTLYPYRNTVFPLNLESPLVQWQTGGSTANSVQVALRFPAGSATPTFLYVNGTTSTDPTCTTAAGDPTNPCLSSSVPAWKIPQHIWDAFGRTAAGHATGGDIVIRRRNGSTRYADLTIPVKFATESLTGTVYYTQYRRNFNAAAPATTLCTGSQVCTYSSSAYTQGQTCPVGNVSKPITSSNSSMTRAIDLSLSSAPNSNPFNPDNSGSIVTGCPVCHSVSANGRVYVSSNWSWQKQAGGTTKGINLIDISATGFPSFTGQGQSPTYTGLTENGQSASGGDPYNNNERTGENSRGYAYSAISPDGSLVLQGATFWGNTIDQAAANNTQDATLRGVTNYPKPYFFAKTATPGLGVQFATTAALPSYSPSNVSGTCSSGYCSAGAVGATCTTNSHCNTFALTAASGTLTVDDVSMGTVGYAVLVKDEVGSNARYNGIYAVYATSPWSLRRRTDAYTTGTIVPNMDVRVTDGNANRGKMFYVSAPNTGTITINTTNVTFSRRPMPPLVLSSSAQNADFATTAPLTPATVSLSSNVLSGGYPQALGSIDGHTMSAGDTLLVKDQATQSQNGIYEVTVAGVGGIGAPISVDYATTAALPAHTQNAGGTVLTASANAALVVDGTALSVGASVVVKNESVQTRNGIYNVTATGGGGGMNALPTAKFATTAALPSNTFSAMNNTITSTGYGALTVDGSTPTVNEGVLVKDESTQSRNGVYRLSTVGTGGSTALTSVRVATTAALPSHGASGIALTATASGPLVIDGVTLSSMDAVLVKDEGATSRRHGVYNLTTQGVGLGGSALASGSVLRASTGNLSVTQIGNTLVSTNGGALTFDGLALGSGNAVLLKDQTATDENGVYTMSVVGAGSGSTNFSSGSATVATTASLTGTWTTTSFGQLTGGTSTWPLTVDGVVLASGNTVLLKNQSSSYQNGIYTLSQTGNAWRLTRRSDADSTGELFSGQRITISGGGTVNGSRTFYVSTAPTTLNNTSGTGAITFALGSWELLRRPDADTTGELVLGVEVSVTGGTHSGKTYYLSTAPAVLNTNSVVWTQAFDWVLTRRSDADANGDLTPLVQVPVTAGTANTGKAFHISSPSSAPINLDYSTGSSIGFTESARWVLTRRDDANQTGEITPGIQVPVSHGSTNSAKTFFLSSPLTTPTINTDAMVFSLAAPWVLTRHPNYNANGEIPLGLQTAITSGTTNAGNAFYVSSPTSGTININSTSIVFSPAFEWELTRVPSANQTGEITPGMEVEVSGGAANEDKVFYVSTPSSGTITINTTGIAFTETSMPSMMVPVFSPDGTKIAYVNADADTQGGAAATGWRRGLSMLDVDLSTFPPTVSNKRRLVNNWNAMSAGVPIKWPFFESDSRSLIYVRSEANEYCSAADSGNSITVDSATKRSCFQASYGSMSPTTRGYFDGKLYSIDTQNPSSTSAELVKLNDANEDGDTSDSSDAMAYQPTVLPFTVGGHRWVIFTSQREFGNQLNAKSSGGTATDFSCAASMLWVSALTDATATATDRSNPAFFLPGQNLAPITSTDHYINERGYLVPSPCKGEGDTCTYNGECCGADEDPATAACRAPAGWTPTDGPPVKTCEELSGTCNNAGGSCETSDDCCNSAPCVDFTCAEPADYEVATFVREYTADCPVGYHADWQFLSYHLTTAGNTSLDFSIQATQNLDDLDTAPVVELGTSTGTTVSPSPPEDIDVGTAMEMAGVSRHMPNLRLMIDFNPSSDALLAPILHDWEMRYTCAPGE